MIQPRITVSVNKKEKALGDLFGIFFEDLNHAADGGLYAELVQNRSFEFDYTDNKEYNSLTAWNKVERGAAHVEIHVETAEPLNNNNLNYLVMEVMLPGKGAGVQNIGYNSGISLVEGETYRFSCFYRRISSYSAPIVIRLENAEGTICYGEGTFEPVQTEWTKVELKIISKVTDKHARLSLLAQDKVSLAFDMVSLFPSNTFMGRKNGMRADIAQFIADMKPRFMRFPGGCLAHYGSTNPNDRNSMYRWKNTLGPIESRPTKSNIWKYNQTLGIGYFEYFQFCEDIGAKPLPVIAAGYDPHTRRAVPLDEMEPWIDEALDLIEFANGDTGTVWGAIRAEMGHPEPFGLEYLAIGNEEVGAEFFERFVIIHHAVREKYPEIKLIGSGGPGAAGSEYKRGWDCACSHGVDYVDEHYYQSPEWFIANMNRYDGYPADGPKVFLGEYASGDDTYNNAIVEAAYMIGMEKAPAAGLACYAPMLCNSDYVNWKPNLIWFNNHSVYGTASYYVQKLFMQHQGDSLLHIEAQRLPQPEIISKPITGAISFETKLANVEIIDIQLKNLETGETRQYERRVITPDQTSSFLDTIDWDHYSLSFRAAKLDESSGTDISGSRSFEVNFGKIDENNKLAWKMDWWMNLSNVCCTSEGRNSELINYVFNPQAKQEYDYRLEVKGRELRTFIDDVLYAETEDKLPIPEELYYSASIDEQVGDVILKVVNLKEYDVNAEVVFDGEAQTERNVTVFTLSDHLDEDRNSFEEPNKVIPKQMNMVWDMNHRSYNFPKRSLTIFRFLVN
ncbi:alpha-L-arabinofuranosidase C-terminal domain-containing protein [Paenibacillus sp. LHD-38]|uniref:alpha-L-arabinofuranosidase C-terminal domain-containing protein n=1 Tax=Paenibacillus sp. LHD-38 TaxID=3072143 RepID=UPI00280D43F2|nr:alpha-L-arabinofuranosidase C-terminal domain-containing protein [Paenibacillus sp. LHD-38]MDQ8738138.1 alpha-L-arabinofuranosidase C-terminal domain-containing protein [Paenibacillus sp. LHD-38]